MLVKSWTRHLLSVYTTSIIPCFFFMFYYLTQVFISIVYRRVFIYRSLSMMVCVFFRCQNAVTQQYGSPNTCSHLIINKHSGIYNTVQSLICSDFNIDIKYHNIRQTNKEINTKMINFSGIHTKCKLIYQFWFLWDFVASASIVRASKWNHMHIVSIYLMQNNTINVSIFTKKLCAFFSLQKLHKKTCVMIVILFYFACYFGLQFIRILHVELFKSSVKKKFICYRPFHMKRNENV